LNATVRDIKNASISQILPYLPCAEL